MTEKDFVENKVYEILREYNSFDGNKIAAHKDLKENYGIDSLKLVELLVQIESAFNIVIDSGSLTYDHFSTAQKISDYIRSQLQ